MIFCCKMCGGQLEIEEKATNVECPYCGTLQTLPRLDSERRINLYDRANHFRRNNEFDRAMGIYEQILSEDATDAEAYWSIVLCRYGIEYVEDSITHKRIPTVNRMQKISVFVDADYKLALEYADVVQREIYEQEAKKIDEIQKGIWEISEKEQPFDVFICYKETDERGNRTLDSVLAQDMYEKLVKEGYKVFFSRITLEDKIGKAYEPYIFAALNSAKVMIAVGTKRAYFESVWVKNEWSRYLTLIKRGDEKILIPAYRDMNPNDLPEEFSYLQAQDMGKIGFIQDLVRGLKKIVGSPIHASSPQKKVSVNSNANTDALLKRISIFLEDGEWNFANSYCERVLDTDPENANAYLGKLMSELHCHSKKELKEQSKPFDDKSNYKKALRYADIDLGDELIGYIEFINERNEHSRLENLYNSARNAMDAAISESTYFIAANKFKEISGYKDSAVLMEECVEKAKITRKDNIYFQAKNEQKYDDIVHLNKAIQIFESIPNWKDSSECIEACYVRIEELKIEAEEKRIAKLKEEARMAEEEAKKAAHFAEIKANEARMAKLKANEVRMAEKKQAETKIERKFLAVFIIICLLIVWFLCVGHF